MDRVDDRGEGSRCTRTANATRIRVGQPVSGSAEGTQGGIRAETAKDDSVRGKRESTALKGATRSPRQQRMGPLKRLATSLEEADQRAIELEDHRVLFEGAEHGELIDSRIIAAVLQNHPPTTAWTVLPPMEVLEMIRGTRATPAFNPNVAAVIFSQGHYTLIVKRATSDDLDWYDSLAGPNGRPPSPETLGVIYGLRDLLAAQNIAAKNVTPQPCRRQQKNACGVEVIRNIGIQVFFCCCCYSRSAMMYLVFLCVLM
eukprot:PhM_4_TR11984/c0_g1_i1/m.13141